MSASDTTEAIAGVVARLHLLPIPEGALTDDERLALDLAGSVVDSATHLVGEFADESELTGVVNGVLKLIPPLAQRVARWAVALRRLEAKVTDLLVIVDNAPGIEIEVR